MSSPRRSPPPSSGRTSSGDYLRSNFRSSSPSRDRPPPVSFDVQKLEGQGTPDWMKRLATQQKAAYLARWGEQSSDSEPEPRGVGRVERSPPVDPPASDNEAVKKLKEYIKQNMQEEDDEEYVEEVVTDDDYTYEEVITDDEELGMIPAAGQGPRQPQEAYLSSGSDPLPAHQTRSNFVADTAPKPRAEKNEIELRAELAELQAKLEEVRRRQAMEDPEAASSLASHPTRTNEANSVPNPSPPLTLDEQLAATREKQRARTGSPSNRSEPPPPTQFVHSAPRSDTQRPVTPQQFSPSASPRPASSNQEAQSSPKRVQFAPVPPTAGAQEENDSLYDYVIEIDTLSSSRAGGNSSIYEIEYEDNSTIPSRQAPPPLLRPPSIDVEDDVEVPTQSQRKTSPRKTSQSKVGSSHSNGSAEKKPPGWWHRRIGMGLCCCGIISLMLLVGVAIAYLLSEDELDFLPFFGDDDSGNSISSGPEQNPTASSSMNPTVSQTWMPTMSPVPDYRPRPSPDDDPDPPKPTGKPRIHLLNLLFFLLHELWTDSHANLSNNNDFVIDHRPLLMMVRMFETILLW